MAVAVKNASEAAPQSPLDRHRLAVSSLVGTLFVLGSLGLVFYGIPQLWATAITQVTGRLGPFVDVALLLVVMTAAAVGVVVLGMRLAGPKPEPGLRAGVFLGCVSALGVAFATWLIARLLESTFFGEESRRTLGMLVSLVVGAGFLYGVARLFLRPSFDDTLVGFEEQGWFSTEPYKRSQGQRVRRGTMLAILLVVLAGVWVLVNNTLRTAPKDWIVPVPFTDQQVHLLPDIRITVPVLLIAFTLWFAYRIVNFPTFADFLIATEAELNKVSWTTRKRLVQDTIVVLITVVLFTVFLFVVDILWWYALTQVGVLKSSPNKGPAPTEEAQPW